MKFIDQTVIQVRAGRGGDGMVSFQTAKGKPKKGPDGGNGGNGGDVYLVGDKGLNTLSNLRFKQWYKAEPGVKGGSNNRTGRCGEDKLVPVPLGTIIKDSSTGEIVGEATTSGQKVLVAKGGKRGYGNARFVSSTHQAPMESIAGEAGEEKSLSLELKLLADVGLAGFPNAGKSTLLSRISSARPKIADYPFTTLVPNLGVVERTGERYETEAIVVADIPGLIEGAGEGRGLGHDFLRHLERTKVVCYLLAVDGELPPVQAYQTLRQELLNYKKSLADKPQILAVSKAELLTAEERETLAGEFAAVELKPLFLSAITGLGLTELKQQLFDHIIEPKPVTPEELGIPADFFYAQVAKESEAGSREGTL